ncbi:amidohydrolase family protein [Roseiterribacter gracilis]|uniref:Amidohydrolase n=1 Tax=Roseiterribacter gracilis TaxID=2812848 RepID=A0A8S8X7X9_9PROT|nr:amidohydrolase [Rhodospirillales bacterium TMPK1]
MTRRFALLAGLCLFAPAVAADLPNSLLPAPAVPVPELQQYVRVTGPKIALQHVRVIDGTGAAAKPDQTVVIENGKITAIQPAAKAAPADATLLDLSGHSVLPGLIGMHDHMYYIARPNYDEHGHSEAPLVVPQMTFSSPRLYLAAGVTTIRTAGSVEPSADLNTKSAIDSGKLLGPHMDVTGPYLEGASSPFIQMHRLRDADDARQFVEFWADRGVTSFKAYMNITRGELKAAIDAAHKRGLKVTGHLCSVTYEEAAELGIDNLEHGFYVNTANDPDKKPDQCPPTVGRPTLQNIDPNGPYAKALIKKLVDAKVAITSTLPVFAQSVATHEPLQQRFLDTLTTEARADYLLIRKRAEATPSNVAPTLLKNDMQMERNFVAAGGLLIAGPDPTGNGGVMPGFGDQREVELLVEAGFTPVEAIKIATLNGATYLGVADRIGSIATGKNADLIVVKGDPSKTIADIENVEIVFKDGIGFDSAKLLASVKGRYGQY